MESKGIDSQYILDYLEDLERRDFEVHSLLMAVGGEVIFEGHYNPYNPDDPYIIHSLTKVLTISAAGIAVTQGKMKMTDTVAEYFPDKLPKDASDNLKAMTLKDLLTQRSGHGRFISGNEWRPLKTSWLEAFMKEPVPLKPGEKYIYSSGNTYMVSAMVQKAMGKTCEDVVREYIMPKLGIKELSWGKSPEGISSGGNGVMMTPEDLLKIAVLYLQKGMWNGERLLTEEWCDLSLGVKEGFDAPEKNLTYGYHWEHQGIGSGIITAGGVFGQTLLVVPSLNLAMVATGGTTQSYEAVHAEAIQRTIVGKTLADKERKYDGKYTGILKKKGERLNLLSLATVSGSPLAEKINGKTFVIEENADTIKSIRLDFSEDSVTYTMADARGEHSIVNGVGGWITGHSTMTGNYLHHQYQNPSQKVVASAQWRDDNTLQLMWGHPEMAFRDLVTIKLTDKTISMIRSVNANSKGPFGGMERPEVKGNIQ